MARISQALGQAAVRSLTSRAYLAEMRRGFSAEDLSRLMVELGADTRLYADELASPQCGW